MRPLIFIPGEPAETPQKAFESVGLSGLAGGAECVRATGPGNLSGMLYAWTDPKNNQIRYAPEEQTWLPASGRDGAAAGRYSVGIWTSKPPTEEDLRRPDHRPGRQVRLGNGEHWKITTPETLDRYPVPGADGQLVWAVDEKFNWLVATLEKRKASGVITRHEDGKTGLSVVFDDEADFWFLCDVLAINYRVTPELVAHLRLLSQRAIRELVAAMFGLILTGD